MDCIGHEEYPSKFTVDMETQMLGSVKPYHRQVCIMVILLYCVLTYQIGLDIDRQIRLGTRYFLGVGVPRFAPLLSDIRCPEDNTRTQYHYRTPRRQTNPSAVFSAPAQIARLPC